MMLSTLAVTLAQHGVDSDKCNNDHEIEYFFGLTTEMAVCTIDFSRLLGLVFTLSMVWLGSIAWDIAQLHSLNRHKANPNY